MAIDTHIYYLPFYFQAIKGTSAQGSGIRILPYLGSVTMTAVVSGACVMVLGYYVPFMVIGASLLLVGCALLHTLKVDTGAGQWIGSQILTGIGFGVGFQMPYSAVQVVLGPDDLPTGNALIVFFQTLGGGLAVSIAQNILSSTLKRQLSAMPGVDASSLIAHGATEIHVATPPSLLPAVLKAFNVALSHTFVLPIAGAGLAFFCGLAMEHRTVRGDRQQ